MAEINSRFIAVSEVYNLNINIDFFQICLNYKIIYFNILRMNFFV